jgi:hypothetical protein
LPVILTQHYLPSDRVYQDVEFSLYHYPRVYFSRVKAYDRFIYYRPLGRSSPRADSKHYFGYGVLGQWFEDPHRPDHRFVNIIQAGSFARLVPIVEARGHYYETETAAAPQFQSAVREISETAYYRILAAADVSSLGVSQLPSTEKIAAGPFVGAIPSAPIDKMREITEIPPGAGYVPHGDNRVSIYESAALQERARADHQGLLQKMLESIIARGGSTQYNNNIDLLGQVGEQKMLIEAKSLNDVKDAVNRLRYGVGQLADYAYRYKSETAGATKVLAFGQPPDRDTSWIAGMLDEERIAFVSQTNDHIVALNEQAKKLRIFQ